MAYVMFLCYLSDLNIITKSMGPMPFFIFYILGSPWMSSLTIFVLLVLKDNVI